MLPRSWVKAFSDIFDSVVLDKYCVTVKGASYHISYVIYLKMFLTNVASQLYIGISLVIYFEGGHFWDAIWISAKFWILPALWRFFAICAKFAIFAKNCHFHQIHEFRQNSHFPQNRHSQRGLIFHHLCHIRCSSRGHFLHPDEACKGLLPPIIIGNPTW